MLQLRVSLDVIVLKNYKCYTCFVFQTVQQQQDAKTAVCGKLLAAQLVVSCPKFVESLRLIAPFTTVRHLYGSNLKNT